MVPLTFAGDIRSCCPAFHAGLILAGVPGNDAAPAALWTAIDAACAGIQADVTIAAVSRQPQIHATREAYKRCGKDPNRYRPSAEALRRRVVQGKGLSRVSVLVDVINLVSLRSGCSIGGFDADRIAGALCWGIGRPDEAYEAIGRGPLNIAGLPVLRDDRGAIGTPTRDEVRTQLHAGTRRLLLVVNDFAGSDALLETIALAKSLLIAHAQAEWIETRVCKAGDSHDSTPGGTDTGST